MRISPPWDPVEVGEIDNIGFDLTRACGAAYVLDVNWTCRLSPFAPGTDPDPQSRVPETSWAAQGTAWVNEPDGTTQLKPGQFVMTQIGPLPASAAGSDYICIAKAYLSDGRELRRHSTVQCVLPGQ